MTVSIVTLLWRNERFAHAFADSLLAAMQHSHVEVELVAVVNGPDGEPAAAVLNKALQASTLRVSFLRLPHNLGFTGGTNRGCAAATGSTLVVANLDLEFDAEFLAVLTSMEGLLAQPGFIAPAVSPAADSGLQSGGELGALRRDFLHRPRSASPKPGSRQRVVAGNGCCLIFGRALLTLRIATVGQLLPEAYHSYYEDVELFWWAQRSRVPVWFVPKLRVAHHHGGSFDGLFRFVDRPRELQASIMANYRLTVWQHADGITDMAGWVVGEAGYLTRLLKSGGFAGLRVYGRSWKLAMVRADQLRRLRGGRLRSDVRLLTAYSGTASRPGQSDGGMSSTQPRAPGP
jgi:GT2 family glycosyltransferase